MKAQNLSRRTFVKGAGACAAIAVAAGLTGCGGNDAKPAADADKKGADYKVTMVTDAGGVEDQSFNQSSWEGLKKLEKDKGVKCNYIESKLESDYKTNLDKAVDGGANLVWGIGFTLAKATEDAAKANPDVNFAIIDVAYDKPADNMTGVMFRAQEPSFMVGYVAGRTTKTNKVGFVGGIKSDIIDQFEYGYRAGVAYAAKELGKTIDIEEQYADSFTDVSKGKAIAKKLYSNGADIVFQAAGGVGVGVIETAKELNKFAIGVDRDQAYLAPDNVLTSALKKCNVATFNVSNDLMDGKKLGGTNVNYGLKEDAVGIPTEHKLMGDETYNKTLEIADQIKAGKITCPANAEELKKFQAELG